MLFDSSIIKHTIFSLLLVRLMGKKQRQTVCEYPRGEEREMSVMIATMLIFERPISLERYTHTERPANAWTLEAVTVSCMSPEKRAEHKRNFSDHIIINTLTFDIFFRGEKKWKRFNRPRLANEVSCNQSIYGNWRADCLTLSARTHGLMYRVCVCGASLLE